MWENEIKCGMTVHSKYCTCDCISLHGLFSAYSMRNRDLQGAAPGQYFIHDRLAQGFAGK